MSADHPLELFISEPEQWEEPGSWAYGVSDLRTGGWLGDILFLPHGDKPRADHTVLPGWCAMADRDPDTSRLMPNLGETCHSGLQSYRSALRAFIAQLAVNRAHFRAADRAAKAAE
jgi:hypothetical protein